MNRNFYVHRSTLLTSLGYPNEKIPRDVSSAHHNHPIPVWVEHHPIRTVFCTTVKIRPSNHNQSYRPYRVYVVCPGCGADVHYSRFFKHAGSKVCRAGCCRTLGLSEDTPPAIARDYALEHDRNDIATLLEE